MVLVKNVKNTHAHLQTTTKYVIKNHATLDRCYCDQASVRTAEIMKDLKMMVSHVHLTHVMQDNNFLALESVRIVSIIKEQFLKENRVVQNHVV